MAERSALGEGEGEGATRAEAIAAWTEVKKLDVPKDYASWVKAQAKRKGRERR